MTPHEPFTIRDARDDERAAVRELTLASFEQYSTIMAPEAWIALRDTVLAGLEAPGASERIVAERGGALVGSVLVFPPRGDGAATGGRMPWPELRLLAVAPEARGAGAGEALVRECVRRTRAAGYPALGLYSSDSMRVARRLYQRLGFEREPEHDFRTPGAELVQAFKLDL